MLADNAVRAANASGSALKDNRYQDPQAYEDIMRVLRDIPECVGFHLCGAYICNRVRRGGLRDEQNQIATKAVNGITVVNQKVTQWVDEATQDK